MSGSFGPSVPANIGWPAQLQTLIQGLQGGQPHQAAPVAPPPPPPMSEQEYAAHKLAAAMQARQAAADGNVEVARGGRGGEFSLRYLSAVAAARAARDPRSYR
jgi:hypothetical protein